MKIATGSTLALISGCVLPASADLTEFAHFHGTPKCTASTPQFSVVPGTRSDLQAAAPERDGDCMSSVVRVKFIYQVLDVEVNRVL